VVTLNEDLQLIASEVIRNNFLGRVNIGLDFFDASINRIGAYVIGTRAAQKAFMIALLEPTQTLVELEEKNQLFERLAMLEELKTKPFSAVWDYYCMQAGVAVGTDYITEIQQYEKEVLNKR
jgi:L-rhamnose isomerase